VIGGARLSLANESTKFKLRDGEANPDAAVGFGPFDWMAMRLETTRKHISAIAKLRDFVTKDWSSARCSAFPSKSSWLHGVM